MITQKRDALPLKARIALLPGALVCGIPSLWLLEHIFPFGAAAPPDPAVFKLAANGDIAAISAYQSKRGDIQIRNWYYYNMLYPALRNRQFKTADFLYERGLRFDYPERGGLRMSDEYLDDANIAVLRWFINPGLSKSYVDERGWTELHMAAQRGGSATTQELLNAGFDPLRTDRKGETPEIIAQKEKDWEVAEVLRTWAAKHHSAPSQQ